MTNERDTPPESAWGMIKDAMYEAWQHTKNRIVTDHPSDARRALSEQAAERLARAAAHAPIPLGPEPGVERPDDFDTQLEEEAMQLGYLVRRNRQLPGTQTPPPWDDDVERELEKLWRGSGHHGFEYAKAAMRFGYYCGA